MRDIANGEYSFMYNPQAKACGFLRIKGIKSEKCSKF